MCYNIQKSPVWCFCVLRANIFHLSRKIRAYYQDYKSATGGFFVFVARLVPIGTNLASFLIIPFESDRISTYDSKRVKTKIP